MKIPLKVRNLFGFAAGSLAALLLCSCASTQTATQVRFHDQANCDAIVRFSNWNLITINKPDTRQDGFLPLLQLPEAEKVLARPDFPHRLAVVICGSYLSTREEAELQSKWAATFGGFGYQRVVFLRAGFHDQVNGLPVIKEIPLGTAQLTGG
jgi:hypothetical protein